MYELHPESRYIFRFWQIFVETVNPLFKIIHVPTLQQRIMDASWNLSSVEPPLAAIMFGIYTLAVTSVPSDECKATFGETRDSLIRRYRVAALRALIAAEFLTTKDLEVLQALFLFLLADPESELTSTLNGAALRLGQKMRLHRDDADSKYTPFEREMRVRLWWQIGGLDSRARALHTRGMRPLSLELGDVRLPLNVNDAELHPDMTEFPLEHGGPTEMVCVLMKLSVPHWLRSSPEAAKIFFESVIQAPVRGRNFTVLEDEVINKLEVVTQGRYFRNLDPRIPLHGFTQSIAKLAVSRMRFKIHHPRGRAAIGGDVYMTREESEMVFEAALTCIEMVDAGIHSKFSSYLFTRLTSEFLMDTVVYVLSELRQKFAGERVELAWRLMGDLYKNHAELLDAGDNSFYVALGELALEAWEARTKEMILGQGVQEVETAPQFIQLLWAKRQKANVESGQDLPAPNSDELFGFGTVGNDGLDWEYWNDFLGL